MLYVMAYLHYRTRTPNPMGTVKPNGYTAPCTSFHIGLDPDLDPYSDGFLNVYCAHFRDGCPSQFYYISIRGSESESEPMGNFCIVQESESESESESGNVNKP